MSVGNRTKNTVPEGDIPSGNKVQSCGNITSKKEYAYTTGTLGSVLSTKSYTYGDSAWGDLLTAWNGKTITSDTIGNPLSDGIWDYTWEHGRQLASMYGEDVNGGLNDVSISYEYNADGLRTGKTVTTRTYELVHVHSYTTTVVAPTCTEAGYTLHECECGDSYQDNETAALGHYFSVPTSMICTRCGYDRSHTHSYTETVVAPTCTEAGYTLHECECGDSYQDNETAALGHYFSVPTSMICTRCGYDRSHTHSYTETVVAPTCTEAGYTLHECECGDSYQDNETAALGHYFSVPTSMICTRCGYNRGESTAQENEQAGETGAQAAVLTSLEDTERVLVSTVVKEYAYVYTGGSLVQMIVTTTVDGGTPTRETVNFAYDASGVPMSVTCNGTTYYYATNLQGDVTAILNTSGTAVVTYTYDAWGNILTTGGSMASTLGTLNPLRYRGYVYDTETGFYYLQSRYYDPSTGRFINADNYPTTGQGFTGNNMFSYCGNNPVSRKDDGGEFWNIVIGAAVGAVVSAVTTAIDSYTSSGKVDWGQVAISAVVGGVSGGVAATGLGAIAQAGITAGASFIGSLASDGYDAYKTYKKTGELPSAGDVGKSFLRATGTAAIGCGSSLIGSGVGGAVSRGIQNKGTTMVLSSKGTTYWTRAQAKNLAKHGKTLINTARGISSVVGTLFTWPTSTALSMGL